MKTKNAKDYLRSAKSFFKSEDFYKTCDYTNLALARDPENVAALFLRAKAYVRLYYFYEAIEDIKTALELNPRKAEEKIEEIQKEVTSLDLMLQIDDLFEEYQSKVKIKKKKIKLA